MKDRFQLIGESQTPVTSTTPHIYYFGEFRLDPARRELKRAADEMALHRKAFDCIVYLIEHRDRAVERDELLRAVWGHDHLSDKTLNQAIVEARRALNDTGDHQRFIKTIRTFGYHWVMPVEVENVKTFAETHLPSGHRALWRRMTLVILVIAVLVAGAFYWARLPRLADFSPETTTADEGTIALLLPVQVQADGGHEWIRLGLMDLMAEQLRTAGQPMVPSDSVIALLRGMSGELDADDLERLTTATGARLILETHARKRGSRWWVSLTNRVETQPPLTAFGEAEDVIEAARTAADQLALSLDLSPVSRPGTESGLEKLLHQIEAARLAQQMDTARALIEAADTELLQHPEIRFQRARIDYYSGRLDAGRAGFESLLAAPAGADDPVLRARALNGLAVIHTLQGNATAVDPLFEQAVRLLTDQKRPDVLGTLYENWATTAGSLADLDIVATRYAQARRLFESTGNILGLASLDLNTGTLETQRGRYTETLRHYRNAVERASATHDIGLELRAHAAMIYVCLVLLDMPGALAADTRVQELLAQTDSAELAVFANLNRAALLHTTGQYRAAENLLRQVLHVTETDTVPGRYKMAALALLAEWSVHTDDPGGALRLAAEVVAAGSDGHALTDRALARAGLVTVRAHLALGNRTAATTASNALTAWAQESNDKLPEIHARLAEAELAVHNGRREAARTAYELAFELAVSGNAPRHLLWVAQSYIPWLLGRKPGISPDTERALLIAGYLSGYADRHYDVALLQLQVYQALGPSSAWHTALARAVSLAGERDIPAELTHPPE